jgi:ATP adenylyltransferase
MNRLFAPWRMKYILDNKKENGCIFCNFPEENKDEKRLILARSEKCFIMLNAFPYNNGHLMVSPYRHIADYDDLSIEELVDIHVNVQKVIKMLKRVQNPQGFNVGLNLGKTAGAGFDEHLHIHIVPRWNGDTNFMPVLDDTRVIPQSLLETYRTLKNDWDKHE